MPLARLTIDLEARLAGLQEGFDKAQYMAERASAKLARSFDAASAAAIKIGGALGASLAGGALVAFVKNTVDGVDRLNDLSDATGASVEKLSALEDQALRTNNSFESVSDALVKLNKALSDAKPDSEQARAIEGIGLSVAELRRIDPVDALKKVATAFQGFENDGTKARYMMILFQKSLREVAPLLKDVAEQGELVATVSTKQAEEAEKFNKQLANLAKNSTDTARAIIADLLPTLNTLLEKLKSLKDNGGLSALFGSIGNELKSNLKSEQLTAVVKEITELQAQIDKRGGDAYLTKRMAALRAEAKKLSREINDTNDKLKGFAGAVDPVNDYSHEGRNAVRKKLKEIQDKPKTETISEAQKYLESLEKQLEKTQNLSVEETTLAALQTGRLKLDGKVTRETLIALSKEIDLTKSLQKYAQDRSDMRNKEYEDAIKAGEANEAAEKNRLKAIIDQTATAKLQVALHDIELVNDAYTAGKIDVEQWAQAQQINTAKVADTSAEKLDELSQFAVQIGRASCRERVSSPV